VISPISTERYVSPVAGISRMNRAMLGIVYRMPVAHVSGG
jgi:hypothetical protein